LANGSGGAGRRLPTVPSNDDTNDRQQQHQMISNHHLIVGDRNNYDGSHQLIRDSGVRQGVDARNRRYILANRKYEMRVSPKYDIHSGNMQI
jgi:hypothetical protein